jgi:hypothetical protein
MIRMFEPRIWHKVALPLQPRWRETWDLVDQAIQWCEENIGPKQENWLYMGAVYFEFRDPVMASEFALVWG